MDIFEKCTSYTDARDAMRAGLYPYFMPLSGNDGATAVLHGRRIVMCGSNNYLGLTSDPRVRQAARNALDTHGTSCTGSRFLNGNLALHEELEREIADFLGKPAALVLSTGYQTNLGTVGALLTRHETILADRAAHASLLDGSRLSGAQVLRFRHNDPAALRRRLAAIPASRGVLVLVEGVYSMEGDVCDLPAMAKVCREFGARLLLDDAHGLGVLGGGRGTAAHFGLTGDVDLITVTFSKSLASLGGAVAGDEDVIHFLRHHARGLIFSAAATAAGTAAALAALRVLRVEPWRVTAARENADFVRRALTGHGIPVAPGITPVMSLRTAGATEAFTVWRRLLDRGVYTNPVVPPAASPRLRLSFTAAHTREHLTRAVEAVAAEAAAFTGAPAAHRTDEMETCA